MKRLFIIILTFLCFLTATQSFALDKETENFKATIDQLQLALVFADMDYVNKHLALDSILRAKIKKFSGLVQKQSGFWKGTAARIVGAGDSALAKTASSFILSQYSKSPKAQRKSYKRSLSLTNYSVKGDLGIASGSFMGKSASVAAKKINGEWVVVSAESPVIDAELKKILKLK